PTGVDYAPFVQADISGLAVEASGQQLCIEGVRHGERYALTLRAGLPAESGEVLAKPVQLSPYGRGRTGSGQFPGRASVLPAADDAGLPIVGVTVTEIDLTLARLSDRNLVQTIREDYFGRSLDPYEAGYFTEALAEPLWTGKAEIATELNKDVTTRLPIGE